MKYEIMYIEKSNGSNHDGDAWIGKCYFSKSGSSIYFDGKIFKKGQSFSGNHFNIETGENYWISKVKKNGQDRHRFGKGPIHMDKTIINEYLDIVGFKQLPKNKFILVELINIPSKEKSKEIENEINEIYFDTDLCLKNIKNLNIKELEDLFGFYNEFNIPSMYKKNRKKFIFSLREITAELEQRRVNH